MLKIIIAIIVLPFTAFYLYLKKQKASNQREWEEHQKILPHAKVSKNKVEFKNIRNFKYKSEYDFTIRYYDKTYNLNDLKSVDYIIVPIAKFGIAHTFLSFGFKGGNYLAISIESRREKGERFSPWQGLFNRYELIYLWADEKDVIDLRVNHRNNKVYLYPIEASPNKVKSLFLDMVKKTNKLYKKPEFYNSITKSCSTTLVKHINKIAPKRIPFDPRIIFTKSSDALAYKLGLIKNDKPLSQKRKQFLINKAAKKFSKSKDFSVKIREEVGIFRA